MNVAKILLVILSNNGHWLGGQEGRISIRWAADVQQPEAVLVWDLTLNGIRVDGNQVAMARGSNFSVVRIKAPEVRVRTTMQWQYRLHQREDASEIARGLVTIHVYPDNLLAGLGKRMADKKIVVWDRAGQLSEVLARAKVPHQTIEHPSKLQFARPDVILVGRDELDGAPFAQSSLIGQARAGAGILIFKQTRARALAGYAVARRPVPSKLAWREDHLLLEQFRPEDLQSWLTGEQSDLWAIQLPADEPALEVGYWPREVPGEDPVPIDALLVAKAVGKGRVVLCQIPLGDWPSDPRSQRLLANALNYLTTRPEPTRPPSQRRTERPVQPEPIPTITIPPGDGR